MTKRLLLVLALTLFATTGCNVVFKQSIQQGNAIEQEDLDKLRLGMTKNQVAFLLGTPAVRDPFHQDRWDYVSTFSRRGDEAVMRKVTLYFDNGGLSEMIGVEADEFIFEDEEPVAEESADEDGMVTAEEETSAAEISPLETPEAQEAPYSEATTEVTDAGMEAASAAVAGTAAAADEAVVQAVEESAEAVAATATEPADLVVEDIEPAGDWAIQLGAFDSEENARIILQRLQDAGFDAQITPQETSSAGIRYLVRKYGIDSKASAEALVKEIFDGLGINGFIVPASE